MILDTEKHKACVAGQEVRLTRKEFAILHLLFSHPETVFSREAIALQVWGRPPREGSRTFSVTLGRLRAKLGSCSGHIATHTGYGYCFNTDSL